MTEAEIELKAERIMNTLDRALMRGDIDQKAYKLLVDDIEKWSKEEYAKLKGKRK